MDAREVPDLFARVRPLVLRQDGSPRMLVRASWPIFLSGTILWPPLVLSMGFVAEGGRWATQMAMIRFAFMGIPFTAGMVYLRFFADAIRPETGCLAKLGVGNAKVSAHKIRTLRRWRALLVLPALGLIFFGFVFIKFLGDLIHHAIEQPPCGRFVVEPEDNCDRPGDNDDCCFFEETYAWEKTVRFIPCAPFAAISLCVGYPAAMAWYVSMKVAVMLALEDVTNVLRATNKSALIDDAIWDKEVARPAIKLATETMPHLSHGWGNGTGFTALLFAVITILNFVGTVHDIRIGSDSSDILRRAGGVVGGAMAPFLLAIDAAHVSSRCDHLLKAINNMRLEWTSTQSAQDVHARVYPLQVTLNELNHGQGLGFTIFTKVVDKKTLNLLAISIASFFGTVSIIPQLHHRMAHHFPSVHNWVLPRD